MYAGPVTFKPTHTLVMTTNTEPHLVDPALRARVRLIPCDSPEESVKPLRRALVGRALTDEAPGILAAMMREAAAWLADHDTASTQAAPASVRGLADALAEGQDPIREWVETCTVPTDPGTPGRTLYSQRFARWHQDHPRYRRSTLPTETAFGRRLTELGYAPAKHEGLWYRSLSVLEANYGVLPQPPTPAAFMGQSQAGSGGLLAGSGGFPSKPATGESPRSGPTFVGDSGGLAGFPPIKDEETKSSVNRESRERGGKNAPPARIRHQ